MSKEKVLILEAPWSVDIEDTQATTRDIYASAETLLGSGHAPVRMIHRPLISTMYLDDIEQFVELDCNQRGANAIVLSAHEKVVRKRRKRKIQRRLTAFDGEVDVSSDVRPLKKKLARSVIVLDACELGVTLSSFRKHSGAHGVVGFAEEVDWVDSSMFVLAMLFKLHQEEVLNLKRARRSTKATRSRAESVIIEMTKGLYASMARSLGVQTSFWRVSPWQQSRSPVFRLEKPAFVPVCESASNARMPPGPRRTPKSHRESRCGLGRLRLADDAASHGPLPRVSASAAKTRTR